MPSLHEEGDTQRFWNLLSLSASQSSCPGTAEEVMEKVTGSWELGECIPWLKILLWRCREIPLRPETSPGLCPKRS